MISTYTSLRKEYSRLWRIFYRMNKRVEVEKSYIKNKIKICDEWNMNVIDIEGAFINFFDDMIDGYDDTLELDRINPWGHYEPKNVRWATRRQNMNNQVWHYKNAKLVEAQTLGQKNGLSRDVVYVRIKRGWDPHDAATMPRSNIPYRFRKKKK